MLDRNFQVIAKKHFSRFFYQLFSCVHYFRKVTIVCLKREKYNPDETQTLYY